jgi:hypothetical protein
MRVVRGPHFQPEHGTGFAYSQLALIISHLDLTHPHGNYIVELGTIEQLNPSVIHHVSPSRSHMSKYLTFILDQGK